MSFVSYHFLRPKNSFCRLIFNLINHEMLVAAINRHYLNHGGPPVSFKNFYNSAAGLTCSKTPFLREGQMS